MSCLASGSHNKMCKIKWNGEQTTAREPRMPGLRMRTSTRSRSWSRTRMLAAPDVRQKRQRKRCTILRRRALRWRGRGWGQMRHNEVKSCGGNPAQKSFERFANESSESWLRLSGPAHRCRRSGDKMMANTIPHPSQLVHRNFGGIYFWRDHKLVRTHCEKIILLSVLHLQIYGFDA